MSELRNEILDRISDTVHRLTIDCPECESMDDDQYTCTTCWCEGGSGKLKIAQYIKIMI